MRLPAVLAFVNATASVLPEPISFVFVWTKLGVAAACVADGLNALAPTTRDRIRLVRRASFATRRSDLAVRLGRRSSFLNRSIGVLYARLVRRPGSHRRA